MWLCKKDYDFERSELPDVFLANTFVWTNNSLMKLISQLDIVSQKERNDKQPIASKDQCVKGKIKLICNIKSFSTAS